MASKGGEGRSVGEICGRAGKKTTTVLGAWLHQSSGAVCIVCGTELQLCGQGMPQICGTQWWGHLYILHAALLIGTSPYGRDVCNSNWNVCAGLTRASIMFFWPVGSDFLSASQFRLLCPSLRPAGRNSSNQPTTSYIWSLIYWGERCLFSFLFWITGNWGEV